MIFKKFFERLVDRGFLWLGFVIGMRPYQTISIILIICIVMSAGFIRFDEVNNVRTEYSPLNSPSRKEYAVARTFLKQNGTLDPAYLMVSAEDEGSLLRDPYRFLLMNLTKTLRDNVTIVERGVTYGFRDLCEPYCELNTAFLAFLKLYDPSNPSTSTYPRVDVFGTQAFIGNNVYGVTLKNDSTSIESFTTAILPYYLVSSYENTHLIAKWLIAAREMSNSDRFKIFKCEFTGDSLVSLEVRRMGVETAPMIALSVIAMIVFVTLSSLRYDPKRAKIWESIIGCLIPLLALLSTTGLLSWCGWKFQSIIVAAFFLVLSVGVDDVFIILRAWDRTNTEDDVPKRMSETLYGAGPSILISSITNAMAFIIGISSQTPAVRSFSLYAALAIIVCLVYQLTMFSAVLAASGYRERKGLQSVLCCLKANPKARSVIVGHIVAMQNAVIKHYSRMITTWPARFFLVLVMCWYYYASVIGIRQLRTFIAIEKLALPDSYLATFQERFESSLKMMQPISVFVMNPGDLRDPERLSTIKNIIHDFENATFSYGADSTFSWLHYYEEFLSFYSEAEDFTYVEIPFFMKSATYFYLSSFVKYNETACLENEPSCITSFFFITNFHGHIKYHELIPALNDWRSIAAKYSEFDIYAFTEHSPFIDQTMIIDSTVWSSIAAAFFCTAIACFLFIPNVACMVTACSSVLSITIGILGLLSLWGLDLDPLSMAALLMAVGFSVDFTSHIAYHFYKSKHEESALRIEETLTCIGWPLVQVGLSTIIAISPIFLKPSYTIVVFFKTIVIVCLLGMFHGLVLMPAILSAIFELSKDSFGESLNKLKESSLLCSHQHSIDQTENDTDRKRIWSSFWTKKVAPEPINRQPAFNNQIITRT